MGLDLEGLKTLNKDASSVALVEGLERLADVPREDRASFLAKAIGKAFAEEWLSRFKAADTGAEICENIAAIRSANSRLADGAPGTEQGSYSFSTFRDHPSGRAVTQVDSCAIRSGVGKSHALPSAGKYGASTRQVLR